MCSWFTHGLAADATARMPPHGPNHCHVDSSDVLHRLQPLTCGKRSAEFLHHAGEVPGRGARAPVELLHERLSDFLLRLSLAVKRAEPLADRPGPVPT